jgi:hypothetical protein
MSNQGMYEDALRSGTTPEEPGQDHATAQQPAAAEEFAAVLRQVEAAAREWGVRPDQLEGRFVSALMAAIGWSGRVSAAAQEEFKTLFRQQREACERELASAREITRAAHAGLTQARTALIVLQVEKENLTAKMIKETLPLFAERLKGALIIREKRWNEDVKRRRLATAGMVTLGLVFGGYGLRVWQDGMATSALERWCLAHPLQASSHIYCDMTSFGLAAQ